MLYNYYMKKLLYGLLIAGMFPLYAAAEMTVVRVDGEKIYLDISQEAKAPAKGSTFKVIVSSETLTNPATGKNLGEIYHYSQTGKITEVQPLYAVGEIQNAKGVTVGKKAVLEEEAVSAAPVTPASNETPKSTRSVTKYEPLEQAVISVTQADVTAPGANNIITLSDKNEVFVFSRAEKETLKQERSYTLPVGKKGLFVSAAPVKAGPAQIFVTVFAADRGQISTLVLTDNNGTLEQTATLPYFVKELGCGKDKKIWAQRPFVLGNQPGNAREVVFEKNKFVASGASFNTRHNWLAGLNYYPVQEAGTENLLTTASDGTLRVLLKNGKRTESKDLFGSSPLRVSYKQEILKFYPAVQVFGTPGESTIAAVENDARFGLLSEAFGQYRNGKIHFLSYEKGSLKITDTVELDGILYDTACTDTSVLTAEVLPDGTSRVVEILK